MFPKSNSYFKSVHWKTLCSTIHTAAFHHLSIKGRFFRDILEPRTLWKGGLGGSHLEAAGDTGKSESKRAKDRKQGTFHWLGNSSWSLRKEFTLASSGKLWIKCLGTEKPVIYSTHLTNMYWAPIRCQASDLTMESMRARPPSWFSMRQDVIRLTNEEQQLCKAAKPGFRGGVRFKCCGNSKQESSWRVSPFSASPSNVISPRKAFPFYTHK